MRKQRAARWPRYWQTRVIAPRCSTRDASGTWGWSRLSATAVTRLLEDAGEISGNHNSSFGVDEPATVARMLTWIDSLPRGQRFFLTYLPIAGHHPYVTPERGPFAGTDEITQYRNALHYGDVSLGALMEGLRARGLEENTVWVIYGDHGEAFRQHEGNYGHTFFLFEENVHVPFLIAVPGVMRKQVRVRKVVSLVDTAPTILDLMGIRPPANYQGRACSTPRREWRCSLPTTRWDFSACATGAGSSCTRSDPAE